MSQSIKPGFTWAEFRPYARYIAEWCFWAALIGLYFQQTSFFDEEISNYRFGPDGWPRVVCIAAFIGATFQLILQIHSQRSNLVKDVIEYEKSAATSMQWVHRLAIFGWPFVFLYFTPTLGAYVSIPIFVVGLLVLLGVRSPKAIALVLLVVYGLTLLVFTRFFFIALPLGSEYLFYDINVAIIEFARIGRY
ncbi:tripartite tricarboxylate transporter TctB family protein [Rhodobacteraceae bacterium KMM 6894]|nr:tripartite tricarboxylate transporter TctB family protein [Rhodobacteraceae bacterium KMM 6894]